MSKIQSTFMLLILLFCANFLFANPPLSLDQENKGNHGIAVKLPADSPVKSFFTSGKVVNLTDSTDNFGVSVTILTAFDVTYDEKPFRDYIYIIYSNLKKTDLKIDDSIDSESFVGYAGGTGTLLHPDTSDLLVYIYTENPSPLMSHYSDNQYIEENGIFWWNPGFLFKKKN